MKIAYCIPALYYPSGMERVLTLKANYFAEVFGYDIRIILTDGKGKNRITNCIRPSLFISSILIMMN